jgi:outer membrane biosynthesis protein TonB
MNPTSDKSWRANAWLVAGLLLVIAPYRASGQPLPAESPSNIECLERLEIPDYPPLARSARIQATQTVKVLLSNQATVQSIEILKGKAVDIEKFFNEGVEKSLKNSRFSKTCGGKTITLVFQYELSNDNGSLAFEPPNHFLIRSGAMYIK